MIPRIGLLLVQLLTGVVPMDNWKVRIQEEDFGSGRNTSCRKTHKNSLSQAPWSLSKEDACTVNSRRGQLLAPVGIGF